MIYFNSLQALSLGSSNIRGKYHYLCLRRADSRFFDPYSAFWRWGLASSMVITPHHRGCRTYPHEWSISQEILPRSLPATIPIPVRRPSALLQRASSLPIPARSGSSLPLAPSLPVADQAFWLRLPVPSRSRLPAGRLCLRLACTGPISASFRNRQDFHLHGTVPANSIVLSGGALSLTTDVNPVPLLSPTSINYVLAIDGQTTTPYRQGRTSCNFSTLPGGSTVRLGTIENSSTHLPHRCSSFPTRS